MTDPKPEEVLVTGRHYKIRYKEVLEGGAERSFTGKFERYVDEDDLCIFHEDTGSHAPKAVVWSTEMLAVEELPVEA
jgi:hypothetical protein